MERIAFVKGHGTENDFVLIPDLDGALDLGAATVAALCHRRAGIGGDGILRVVRTEAEPDAAPYRGAAEWFMDYRNADGSLAQMCGNGIRVFARYLVDAGHQAPGQFLVATRGGVRTVTCGPTGDVTVDMGPYALPDLGAVNVTVGSRTWPALAVMMPNPHAVVFVEDLTEAGDLLTPPQVTPGAFPEGVNVEFVLVRGPRHVAMRVHERGVGETQACGTGACAVMVASARRAGAGAPTTYRVEQPGGSLLITLTADGNVEMTGPAVLVAEGTWLLGAEFGSSDGVDPCHAEVVSTGATTGTV
ncbi:diaminopimelate epimerase [Sporichthya polymorpha]|uniref:diaminopimelate epimerase n=1 Tax=Sporichthya polymorpha TaxID=35751 RepID=UPI0003789399|nr:diaminopimelate epimerase [Sporichthya polymorpha]